MQVQDQITEFLNAVYKLSAEDRERLNGALEGMEEDDKEQVLVAVYQRYEAFEENVRSLTKGLRGVANDLDDHFEHQEAEKLLLEL